MDSHFAKPHAFLVCGPGLGHVNGCVSLAKSLVSAGFSVTLACFARCYHTHSKTKRLKPLDPAIRFEIVPDGLEPPVAQNYADLFVTTEAMREGLESLVEKLRREEQHNPVTCFVSDPLMAWTQDVANKLGVPRIEFFTSNATAYLVALAIPQLIAEGYYTAQKDEAQLQLSENPAGVFIDCIKGLPRFPLNELDRGLDPNNPILQAFAKSAARATEAERVLIHSVTALESSAFVSLFKEYGIKAYAVGPLIMDDPTTTQAHQQQLGGPNPPPPECLTWLDGRASSSVLYVSFGSNATLSRQEIVELAHGLEASGQPFLWVVRSDATTDQAGLQLSDILPLGFQTRTQSRGLIAPWVPQVAVLAHPAVGGFLTHCGWNSTLETLWMGVPMLCCPRGAEQKTNARFIAQDWGVGIELQRTDTGGFHRCEVEKSVNALMTAEEGLHARTRAQELKGLVRKAKTASHSNLVAFVDDMTTLLPYDNVHKKAALGN